MNLLLDWRVWGGLLVALGLAASHYKAYSLGGLEARADHAEQMMQIAQAAIKSGQEARAKEQALQAKITTIQKRANDENLKLRTDSAALVSWLSERPTRAPDSATNTRNCMGATGAELSRPDSSFLTSEATRADRIRLQLAACQAAYDSAREAVK